MATPMADNTLPLSGNAVIDALTQGSRWDFSGGNRQITYSLWDSVQAGWNATTTGLADLLFATYGQYIDVSFTRAPSLGSFSNNNSDLSIILAGSIHQRYEGSADILGEAIFPDRGTGNQALVDFGETRGTWPTVEGDVILDTAHPWFAYYLPGGQGYFTLLHEVGHALGLKHPKDQIDNRPTFSGAGVTYPDQQSYTMMSYVMADGASPASGNLATPGILDVLALQWLYGANPNTGAGNTTYALTTTGYNATIWDVGGIDTFDASSNTTSTVLNLNEGRLSQFGTVTSRVGVAFGVTIENALGGSGSDLIWANEASNVLDGNDGNDTVYGEGANDSVRGLNGDDLIYGDAGNDDVNGNVGLDTVYGGSGLDIVRGGQQADLIYGDDGDDPHVNGNIGADTVYGGAGNDAVFGGQNDDRLFGEAGNDTLSGDIGSDTLTGGSGADWFTLRPGGGSDMVTDFSFSEGDRIALPSGTSYAIGTVEDLPAIMVGSDSLRISGGMEVATTSIVFV